MSRLPARSLNVQIKLRRLIGLYKKVTFIVLSKVPDAALLEEPEEVKRMTKELLLPSSDDI